MSARRAAAAVHVLLGAGLLCAGACGVLDTIYDPLGRSCDPAQARDKACPDDLGCLARPGGGGVCMPRPAVVAVTSGTTHSCAVTAVGAVLCWGGNGVGQLGDASRVDHLTPVALDAPQAFAQVSAGDGHTCAVDVDQQPVCWGLDDSRQLGTRGGTERQLPAPVTGVPTTFLVSAGRAHTCLLVDGPNIVCFGDNDSLQLGRDTPGVFAQEPESIAGLGARPPVQVASGGRHTCALFSDEEGADVKCWGDGSDGQLGDGGDPDPDRRSAAPVDVVGLTAPTQLSAGGGFSCVVHDQGHVACWGVNAQGQLGDTTLETRTSPAAVAGIDDAVQVACGREHACVLHATGTVSCWGSNTEGQLGDGSAVPESATPVAVANLEGVTQVSAGYATHSCALLQSGDVKCWGGNGFGQLGNGTTVKAGLPGLVQGLP